LITTLSSTLSWELASRSMPYHEPLVVLVEPTVTGAVGVPSATRRPRTISSPRLALVPACMMSELPWNSSVTPGSIVSVTPAGIVRSPVAVYVGYMVVSVVFDHSVPYSPGVGAPSCCSAP
jgi:hypothetical protein